MKKKLASLSLREKAELYEQLASDDPLGPELARSIKEEATTLEKCVEAINLLDGICTYAGHLRTEIIDRTKVLADNVEKAVYVYEHCYSYRMDDLLFDRCQTIQDCLFVLVVRSVYPIGSARNNVVERLVRLVDTPSKKRQVLEYISKFPAGKYLRDQLEQGFRW